MEVAGTNVAGAWVTSGAKSLDTMTMSPGTAFPVGDDTRDDGASISIPSPPSSTSAHTTSSPGPFLSLSEQAFTPLSMHSNSDTDVNDDADRMVDRVRSGATEPARKPGNACMTMLQGGGEAGNHCWFAPNPSTDSARKRGIVSSTVQSPPTLGATAAPSEEYDLASTKNNAISEFIPPTPNFPIQKQQQSPSSSSSSPARPETPAITSPASNCDAGSLAAKTLQAEARDIPAAHPQPLLQALRATAGQPQLPSNPPIVHDGKPNSVLDLVRSADGDHGINKFLHTPADRTTPALIPPATVIAAAIESTVVRPKPKAVPRNPQPQPLSTPPTVTPDAATQPAVVRKVSNASVTIQHPIPDLSARSGACLGNIAALEASAERLSMTSSIEDAIRDAHNELKRSDSRRSSILRASIAGQAETDDATSTSGLPQLPASSRQSSILGTNNTARLGGYSPAGYVMSPNPSLSNASTRLRSGSKTSPLGVPPPAAGMADPGPSVDFGPGDDFSFMSRHGPGKSSVRSVLSNKPPLAEITEMEPPMTLTQDVLDEADRIVAAGEDVDDEDDTIRANSQQHTHTSPVMGIGTVGATPPADEALQPKLRNDYPDLPSPNRLQLHRPDSYVHYGNYDNDRPTTSGSCTTEQAQTAFGDFDGVHYDPLVLDFPAEPVAPESRPRASKMPRAPPRPTSYVDNETGQHMLFYPARVPAMLNLPPKLAKNAKPAARRKTRSQVLNSMPAESRESRIWLPDPLEGLGEMGTPLMDGEGADGLAAADMPSEGDMSAPVFDPDPAQLAAGHSRHPSETGTVVLLGQQERTLQKPQRLTDSVNRKSRMANMGDVAPQLRASVFFDLPSESPRIEVKDGSATATLDSILDASAGAPVSAFTDHTFAGKLGAEVYGREKKPKKKARETTIAEHRNSALNALTVKEPKKRASFLSLMPGARHHNDASDEDEEDNEGRKTVLGVPGEGGVRRVSSDGASARHSQLSASPNQPAPHGDRNSDNEEDDDDDDDADEDQYEGPPTTLLAELQIRKQQQKLRTRPVHKVFPNGLHSTLLDLDTVAEVERKARKGKKVNLAWEDPSAAQQDAMEDEYDEDVPLGMLYAAKAAAAANGGNISNMDISAVMGEIHRPLGLMERRDLEENEPLSRRRDRLQGREPAGNLGIIQQRMSMMALTPGGLGARTQSRLELPLQMEASPSMAGDAAPGEDVDPEIEGETLAERKRRLHAETLPRARPVSGAFSAELLSQFGDLDDEDAGGDSKGRDKVKRKSSANALGQKNGPPQLDDVDIPEEEETLGQRRRRIQAEREAREREMGGAVVNPPGRTGTPLGLNRSGTPLSLNPNMNGSHSRIQSFSGEPAAETNRDSRRLSMAGILGAHPFEGPQGNMDPREQERLRLEAVAAHSKWEQDAKMAAMRSQMPQSLSNPAVGAANGGYMNGRFNDGLGGGVGAGATRGLGYGGGAALMQPKMPMHSGTGYAAGVNAPTGNFGGTPMGGLYGMNNPYNGAGAMQMQMPPIQGQLDRVERWRQSVMP